MGIVAQGSIQRASNGSQAGVGCEALVQGSHCGILIWSTITFIAADAVKMAEF